MKYILSILACIGFLTSCSTKTELSRTGAFYDLAPHFVRSADNKDYFLSYGKGHDEEECLINASTNLLKTLIYEGSREGINIPAILNEPKSIAALKTQEHAVMKDLLARIGLLESNALPTNRIRQSANKNTLCNMSFEIGVDRNLLREEIAKFKRD